MRVTSLDAFADLDQHPDVDARAVLPFTPATTADIAQGIATDAVVYLSSFENAPDAVARMAQGRTLLGNTPEVLSAVRDPWQLREAWRSRGLQVPSLGGGPGDHLLKPLASGGGGGITRWVPGSGIPAGHYVQEYVDGRPGSIAFVASPRGTRLLGLFQQIIGEPAFGASGFRYCGNVLDARPPHGSLLDDARALADSTHTAFDLAGVNGIDVIERDGRLWPVEVNPRWTAAMELLELAHGLNVFALHLEACTTGRLSEFELATESSGRAVGKAIVFARSLVSIAGSSTWLACSWIRDVPRDGTVCRPGEPVCTVLAEGETADACRGLLTRRAEDVYARLAELSS